ncbi:MAG: hypothetical protein AB7N73_14505 [Gemmatimonadales bacterium]
MPTKTSTDADAHLNTMRGSNAAAFTPYIGLLTAVTNVLTGAVTETSYTSYARQAVTFGAPSTVGGKRKIANSAPVVFPVSTGGTPTITHFGIYDAVSGGNLRKVVALAASRVINLTDPPTFAAGDLGYTEE